MRRLLLYGHTLRYLEPSQVFWRLIRPLRMHRRSPRRVPPAEWNADALTALCGWLETAARTGLDPDALVTAWLDGRLHLAGQDIPLSAPDHLPWQDSSLSRLTRFQLHGFRYLRWLVMAVLRGDLPENRARQLAATVVQDWIERNPPPADPAWDPYPTAERLLHWIIAAAVGMGLDTDAVRSSLARQIRWLEQTLEYDLRGNHLLCEWTVLALAGAVTSDMRRREQALAAVRKELGEQLLPSGEHYERSWMYHAQLLLDLLVLRAVLRRPPEWLTFHISRMTDALEHALHEDGEIPLFNDAAFAQAPPARLLITLSRAGEMSGDSPGQHHVQILRDYLYPAGTSRICTAAGTFLIKGGAPGPDHQPGHAHADPGTWELSRDGLRWVVDAGTHGYAESPLRPFCRSVWAHNTAVINGAEPLECWGVFRVARRCRFIDGRLTDRGGGERELLLRYRWYQRWFHTRVFRADRAGTLWIEDIVEGQGLLDVRALIHLHPRVQTIVARGGREWRLFQDGIAGPVLQVEAGTGWHPLSPAPEAVLPVVPGLRPPSLTNGGVSILDPQTGWYSCCPRFGLALPARCGWVGASGFGQVRLVIRVLPPEAG